MYSPILWAYYADNFKGICIEIEIDETILPVYKINYTHVNPIPDIEIKDAIIGPENEVIPEL